MWSAPRQGFTIQSGSGRKLEIPRLAALARDDSYIRLSGFQGGKGFALFSKRDTMAKESLNTEQLAVGGSRPVDGMRRNHRLTAAPHGVQGPRPLVGKGFLKGETTIGFTL